MKESLKIIDKFFGGIVRDDKSKIVGTGSNFEELDIFANANYMIPEQIMTAETNVPASTLIYAYAAGDDDTVYAYGEETSGHKVRILSVATGGATNPGDFTTLFTSADSTNLATIISDFKFFRTTEASNPTSLYYLRGTSTSWYVDRYNIGAAAEQTWNGSAWAAGTANTSSKLTGLNGTNMRPTMKVIFGELFIMNGNYIAKIAADSTFTEKAFTLPKDWEAIDIIGVSDKSIILARNKNVNKNETRGFWWDLSETATFDDQFVIPTGGPQWIINHKETIKICCAANGVVRFFQLSGAFAGAVPMELPGMVLNNAGTETSTQPISPAKSVNTKDKILYFGLYKTDKSGIYAIGQLDSDKPVALILSKRFNTTDYSLHKPTALLIQGPNYYATYVDNTTQTPMRCESNNSPTRSSNFVYETIWIDNDMPMNNQNSQSVIIATYPLPASTSVTASIGADYSSSYTSLTRANGTVHNTTSAILADFPNTLAANKKAYRIKLTGTSNGVDAPKIQAVGLKTIIKDERAKF